MYLLSTTSLMFSTISVFWTKITIFKSTSMVLNHVLTLYEPWFQQKIEYDDDNSDSYAYDTLRPTPETIRPFGPITENNYKILCGAIPMCKPIFLSFYREVKWNGLVIAHFQKKYTAGEQTMKWRTLMKLTAVTQKEWALTSWGIILMTTIKDAHFTELPIISSLNISSQGIRHPCIYPKKGPGIPHIREAEAP